DRVQADPSVLQERAQELVRAVGVDVAELVGDAGHPRGAEAALARAHAEAQAPPDVVEGGARAPLEHRLQASPRQELALADELVVQERRLALSQARPEPVGLARLGSPAARAGGAAR